MSCRHEWAGAVIKGPVNNIVIDQCESCGKLRLPDAAPPAQVMEPGDALHDAANVVLSAFAKAYKRNGCCLSEIQDEYGADGCMFRGLDVTHGNVAKLRDALAARIDQRDAAPGVGNG